MSSKYSIKKPNWGAKSLGWGQSHRAQLGVFVFYVYKYTDNPIWYSELYLDTEECRVLCYFQSDDVEKAKMAVTKEYENILMKNLEVVN